MRAVAAALGRISDAVNTIALWGAVAAVLTMAFAGLYQVVARYVFDAPPVWTEELARRAMVWAGMLGASVAFHERSDPNLFPDRMARTGGVGRLMALARAAGVLIFVTPILWFSLFDANMNVARGFIGRSLDRKAEMIQISMVWFTAAVPLAFTIIVIHLAAQLAASFAAPRIVATRQQDRTA